MSLSTLLNELEAELIKHGLHTPQEGTGQLVPQPQII